MNFVKYVLAIVLWAVFYLVIAFAIAVGFKSGWDLIERRRGGKNGIRFRTAGAGNGAQQRNEAEHVMD